MCISEKNIMIESFIFPIPVVGYTTRVLLRLPAFAAYLPVKEHGYDKPTERPESLEHDLS